jgi:hypothetical protein
MEPQLWCSRRRQKLVRIKIKPIRNDDVLNKPEGGLWTSTFKPNAKWCSDWLEWCASEMPEWLPESEDCCWVLFPSKSARIVEIDDIDDYINLLKMFGRYNKVVGKWMIDWEKLAKYYDALHLTERGLATVGSLNFELLYPELKGFHEWDVESTVWFRWVFDKAIPLSFIRHKCRVR